MYHISEPSSVLGRFAYARITNDSGTNVANLTVVTASDPAGISGDMATLEPVSTPHDPNWIKLVDDLGKTPQRGSYPANLRGDEDQIREAIYRA